MTIYCRRQLTHNRPVNSSVALANAPCAVLLRRIYSRSLCFATPYYLPQTSYTTGTLSETQRQVVQKNRNYT